VFSCARLAASGVKSLAILAIATVVTTIGIGVMSTQSTAAQQTSAPPEIRQSGVLNLDEQLLEVAKQDPAFGGMFFDKDGRLSMYVTENALAAPDGFGRLSGMSLEVESAFRSHHMMADASTKRINVLPAQFSFLDLFRWREVVRSEVLTLPGVVMADIAEDKNRIRVGIERPDIAASVRQQLAKHGVPEEAVSLEITTPMRRLVSVRSKFRPAVGGIQINFGNYVCTLGFLAIRAGVTGMVTNSHCTGVQGGNTSTIFHQPVASGNTNRIALEVRDPNYFTGGVCPSRRRCRYSDSAFARMPHPSGPAVTMTRGTIAKPVALNALTVTTGRFRVTSENSIPVLNETVNKVGRTTGWSQGRVVATCIDTNVSGTTITQLCQDIVRANVAGGDSGSPVFRITNSPRANDVKLYGVLWGGGTIDGYGTVFVFSALGSRNLQKSSEMGTLTTCAAGFSC
jgi:hypothetical protein